MLRAIRIVHTAVWALFAGSIIAVPIVAWREQWLATFILIGLITVECLVLAANRMRCPLTDIAARYTDDRRANFDIFLPHWLAKYNKHIFGSLFAVDLVFTAILWWT
jgi:hypothetical protein